MLKLRHYIYLDTFIKHAKIPQTKTSMVDQRRKQMEIFSRQRDSNSDRSSRPVLFIKPERHLRARPTTRRQTTGETIKY